MMMMLMNRGMLMIERAFELTKEEEESRGKRHNRTIDPREASIFLTRNVLRSFSRLTREKMMKEEREEEKSLVMSMILQS